MTKRERVQAAIAFDTPDRTPIWHFNYDVARGDILRYDLALVDDDGLSEWGYRWETMDDGTMGQPDAPVIPKWDDLDEYTFPQLDSTRRLKDIAAYRNLVDDHYTLAGIGLTGFTTYTFLRGFENSMVDFLADEDRAGDLLDRIFAFENNLIDIAAREGFDGVHFQDDWGTQNSLIISPALWRVMFKERYRRQFERIHDLGMDVWFHCCGNITAITGDFHEIVVDVLNISQPNVVDIEAVGGNLRGKQCFMVPVSYQTVSISGTCDDIVREAKRLYDCLGSPDGGFIGYVEEYRSIGMSMENYRACIEAFESLGGE